jgi:hypothetical protein
VSVAKDLGDIKIDVQGRPQTLLDLLTEHLFTRFPCFFFISFVR